MNSTIPQQAIILAAGLGTRLSPLTQKVPKPILPVGGIPILLFSLYSLKKAGIADITINLHHLPEKIPALLRSSEKLGLRLRYSLEQPKILGTAGGIAQALQGMRRKSTFVLNGDILCDLDLKAMFRTHLRHEAMATLACVEKEKANVTSFIEYDGQGKIWQIADGPKSIETPRKMQPAIFAGVHLIEPDLLDDDAPPTFGCVIHQIYQPAIVQGKHLQCYFHQASWWDLGSPAELQQVDQRLWQGRMPARMLQLWQEVQEWSKPIFSRK